MKDLFRETVFGRLVRIALGGKLFAYDEELDPSTLQKYQLIDSESSSTSLSLDGEQKPEKDGKASDPGESPIADQERPIRIDQEKGADHLLVDWAPNDPHNPRNWSTARKLFVTFQICLLTTSVYIGSAIYTAGLQGVEAQFHISTVKALLGLTLFVLGYALGPMVWVGPFSLPFGCPPHIKNTTYLLIFADPLFFVGTHVRNTLHRPQPCLRRHPVRLRPPPTPCHLRLQ